MPSATPPAAAELPAKEVAPVEAEPPAAPPATAEPQVASKPPAAPTPGESPSAVAGEKPPSINFAPGSSDLTDRARAELNKLAVRMQSSASLRLLLYAYAAGTEAQAEAARLLSFTRALNVRSYLISQGVSAERIGVRLMGNKVPGNGPADRVDPQFTTKEAPAPAEAQ